MDSRPRIVVVGSSNTDMVVRAARLPRPGETVLGGAFSMVPGGKGANQAVAAARLGAHVTFIARVGSDVFGDNAIAAFEAEGIDTKFIVRDESAPSGVALIGVDEATGENSIIVASGANANLSVDDVEKAQSVIETASVLVCQLETPLETIGMALKMARDAGVKTILNPAPAQKLPDEILANISVLTPNETEARQILGGAPDTEFASDLPGQLLALGLTEVIMTVGSEGVLSANFEKMVLVKGLRVKAVDTTAAGDCFNGALAVALAEGLPTVDAVEFANAAAALSVTKAGAQPSLPTRAEVDAFLGPLS